MAKQSYYALPGVEWVNGARVPADRVLSLTAEEAAFDLGLNRIVLGTTLPPGVPPEPALISTDLLEVKRGGRSLSLTVDDLVSYLSDGGVSPTLLLSTKTFQTGVSSGAILAAITAPAGWALTAETTFGGRVAVAGRNLVAAQNLASAASGTARLRASSPDGLNAIVRTFDLSVSAPAADLTAPTIVSATSYTVPENTPLTISLQASEPVTWAKAGGSDPLAFVLSGSSVTFAAKDFEVPTDTGANNVYSASFTATDAAGNVTPFDLVVTVSDIVETAPDTAAPTITSAAVASVGEGAAFSLALTADEAVTWSKNGGADAGLFTLTGSTLTMTAKDFEAPGDAGADNVYTVIVRATDTAGNVTDQVISVTVTNVLEGALPAITPTTGTAENTAAASVVVLDLPALVEGESRSYIPTTGPAFTFNSSGDLIRGIAAISAGTATGKVRQTRGGVNTDTNVTITLAAGGGVVTLNAVSMSGSPVVGTPFTGTILNRAAGSTLTLTGSGAAGLSVNSSTGVVSGTPTAAGVVNVVETLTDAVGSPRATPSVLTVALAGGGSEAPSGFTYIADNDGSRLTDDDGAYLMEAA